MEQVLAGRRFEIECDPELIRVEVQEQAALLRMRYARRVGAAPAGSVTAGLLDLDHLGSKIG